MQDFYQKLNVFLIWNRQLYNIGGTQNIYINLAKRRADQESKRSGHTLLTIM